jgi:hypothetical protein
MQEMLASDLGHSVTKKYLSIAKQMREFEENVNGIC